MRRAVQLDEAGGGSDDVVDALAADAAVQGSSDWWRRVRLDLNISQLTHSAWRWEHTR